MYYTAITYDLNFYHVTRLFHSVTSFKIAGNSESKMADFFFQILLKCCLYFFFNQVLAQTIFISAKRIFSCFCPTAEIPGLKTDSSPVHAYTWPLYGGDPTQRGSSMHPYLNEALHASYSSVQLPTN